LRILFIVPNCEALAQVRFAGFGVGSDIAAARIVRAILSGETELPAGTFTDA